jgi:hypothetical protein
MSGLISKQFLRYELPFPVNLPATLLNRGTWLVLSTIQLDSTESLSYLWSQIGVSDVGTAPHTIVNANGIVSFGLYKSFDNGVHPRVQTPVETAIYAGESTTYTDVYAVRTRPSTAYPLGTYDINQTRLFSMNETTASGSGLYSFVLANNTSDHDYIVTVSGLARIA